MKKSVFRNNEFWYLLSIQLSTLVIFDQNTSRKRPITPRNYWKKSCTVLALLSHETLNAIIESHAINICHQNSFHYKRKSFLFGRNLYIISCSFFSPNGLSFQINFHQQLALSILDSLRLIAKTFCSSYFGNDVLIISVLFLKDKPKTNSPAKTTACIPRFNLVSIDFNLPYCLPYSYTPTP